MAAVKKHVAYENAPVALHRVCADLTYYPPTCERREDVAGFGNRDVATRASVDDNICVVKYGFFDADIHTATGVSMLAQRDGHCMRAAHDLVRKGRRIPCLVYKQGVAAPSGTAFVHDRVWPQKRAPAMHFSVVPILDDVSLDVLEEVANPTLPADDSVWQQCPMGEGELVYDPPPFPCDRKLREAVLALEVLALDEGQPDQLRRDARLLKYWLCYEHLDDDDKDWTWVVEHFAPSDKYATYILKTAMDIAPEPGDHDLNVLLWFRLVKLEINDCWDDHQQGQRVKNIEEDKCSHRQTHHDVLHSTAEVLKLGIGHLCQRLVMLHVGGLALADIPGPTSCSATLPRAYNSQPQKLTAAGVYASHSVCVVLEVDADVSVTSLTTVTIDGKPYTVDAWYNVDGVVSDSADLDEVISERAVASEHTSGAACVVATPIVDSKPGASLVPLVIDIPDADVTKVFSSLISSATCNALVKSGQRRCRNKATKTDGERCWCHKDRIMFSSAPA
uniref:Uncharacterized protein n=1 Tax=Chlamydomonas euryale TaxID=1486919 RepID=A0A6U2F0E4_9CHLO|mmetsp:Transcript_26000/g.77072  ORF Transcript_26000/g.77072 Transcript_26000/m.77072 type:complete len:505 (+) Transcript_26000:449-1963(+)